MNFDKPYWRTAFRESDGTASSSRLLTGVSVVVILALVISVTVVHRQLPNLEGPGKFLTGVILALYGVSQGKGALAAIFSKGSGSGSTDSAEDDKDAAK